MKVGKYIRTKRGEIHKITDLKPHYENGELIIEKQLVYIDNKCSGWNYEQFKEFIIKSSPNIIDLIEVGDYVNGEKVTNINGILYVKNIGALEEINIKSIVTKEQFEAMEYKCE